MWYFSPLFLLKMVHFHGPKATLLLNCCSNREDPFETSKQATNLKFQASKCENSKIWMRSFI